MANESVIFEVIAEGKGLKVVQKDVNALADSTERVNRARKEGSKGQDNYNKKEKAIHQSNLSSAKSFSKMNQTIGSGSSGLVGAYAVLAANVFAATAAFNALRQAAQVETLIAGLEATGQAAGRNLTVVAERMKEVTGSAISMEAALRSAAQGTSAGFSGAQMAQLAETATAAAISLGRDVGDAVDRVTRGVAKLEPEILDELGLFVRLDDATERYAGSLGKSVDSLTQFERTQAFANATIAAGEKRVRELGGSVDANPYDKLAASLSELGTTFLNIFNTVLTPFVSFLADSKIALAGLIMALTKGIVGSALPVLTELGAKARAVAAEALGAVDASKRAAVDSLQKSAGQLGSLGNLVSGNKELVKELNTGKVTREKIRKIELNLEASIAQRVRNLNTEGKILEKNRAQKEEDLARIRKELALVKQIERERKKIADQPTSISAQGRSDFESRSAGIMGSLDEDGSFSNYKKQMTKQIAANRRFKKTTIDAGEGVDILGGKFPRLSKKLKIAEAGMLGFGKVSKIAVKGLFTAIPVIGQVLFVVDMLIEGLKAGFNAITGFAREQTRLQAAQSALNTVSEHYEGIMEEVNGAERLNADLVLKRGNATKQLVSSTREVVDATIAANAEAGFFGKLWSAAMLKARASFFRLKLALEDLFGTNISILLAQAKQSFFTWIKELVDEFNNGIIDGPIGKFLETAGFRDVEVIPTEGLKKAIKSVDAELKSLQENAGQMLSSTGAAGSKNVILMSAPIQAMNELLKEGGAASEELGGFLRAAFGKDGGLDDVVQAFSKIEGTNVGDGIIEAFGPKTAESLRNFLKLNLTAEKVLKDEELAMKLLTIVMAKGTETTTKQAEAVEGLNKIYRDGPKLINEFAAGMRIQSSVKTVLPLFEQMAEHIDTLDHNSGDVSKKWENLSPALKKFLRPLKDGEKITKEIVQETANLFAIMNEFEILEKGRAARKARELNALSKQNKDNTAAISARQDIEIAALKDKEKFERARLTLTENQLDAETLLAVKAGNLTGLNKEQLEIAGKILLFSEELKTTTSQREVLEQDIYTAQKASLRLQMQATALSQAQVKTAAMEMKAAMMKANLATRGTTALTEAQQLKLKKEAAVAEMSAAIVSADQKFRMLELEIQISELILERSGIEPEAMKKIKDRNQQILDIQRRITDETKAQARLRLEAVDLETRAQSIDIAGQSGGAAANIDAISLMKEQVTQIHEAKKRHLARLEKQAANEPNPYVQQQIQAEIKSITKAIDEGQTTLGEKAQLMATALSPMFEQFKALGPEGELVAAIGQGSLTMVAAFDAMGQAGAGAAEMFMALGAIVAQVSNIINASHRNRVAKIDKEIEAEKKRDGKSEGSLKKIKAMESKKEAMAKKNFEMNKKLQMAQVLISTAAAIAQVWANPLDLFKTWAPVMTGVIAALGAAQLAIIAGTSWQGGGSSTGSAAKPPKVQIGSRSNRVDVAGSKQGGELSYLRGGRGMGSSASDFTRSAFVGAKYRATGGAAYVVGEQGPELFVPEVPGEIVANDEMTAGGQPINATFNIQTIDATNMEETLISQRGNIINMIREAANNQGETFLEGLDTMALGDNY